ncbi:hypothetical protein PBRA_000099 [Plasmodiophora brassicae]|nr:hypothetical protein PBRA_000099 [Plasmodiophora brassicae]
MSGVATAEMPRAANLPTGLRRVGADERAGALYRGPVKAVILDWSGTLADEHVIAPIDVLLDVFKRHGVEITMEEARLPLGLRKDEHIAKILAIPDVQRRWKEAHDGAASMACDVQTLYNEFIPKQLEVMRKHTSLIPGAVDAVDELRDQFKCKIGVTTGLPQALAEVMLHDGSGQGFVPDSNVSADTIPKGLGCRPAPFMVYENLAQLGVYPIHSVVKVDDTAVGVAEGVNAGCWSVGIAGAGSYTNVKTRQHWAVLDRNDKEARLEHARSELVKGGAHYVIDSISLLPVVVRDINSRLAEGDRP